MKPDIKRKSIGYFAQRRDDGIPGGHAFLLARDIPMGIIPYELRRGASAFHANLVPENAEREAWLAELLSVGDHRSFSLKEDLGHFVEEVANHIGYFGDVRFELLRVNDVPVRLASIAHERLVRIPGILIQRIPKTDREYFDGRRFTLLRARDTWSISLPSCLGTARKHRQLLRRLDAMSSTSSGIAIKAFDPTEKSFGYDVAVHHAAIERSEERATRRWGTVPSVQRPIGDSTEYFFISRRLAFLEAQAALREHVFAEINAFLKRLDFVERLVVTGLPLAEEIRAVEARLHAGELTLSEALDEARNGTSRDDS